MMQIISLPFHFSLSPALLPKGSLFESLIFLDFPVAKPLTSRAVCLKGTALYPVVSVHSALTL